MSGLTGIVRPDVLASHGLSGIMCML